MALRRQFRQARLAHEPLEAHRPLLVPLALGAPLAFKWRTLAGALRRALPANIVRPTVALSEGAPQCGNLAKFKAKTEGFGQSVHCIHTIYSVSAHCQSAGIAANIRLGHLHSGGGGDGDTSLVIEP